MTNSKSQTISGFVTGDLRFEIPPYQRNYAWERTHVADLWDDLIEAIEMDRDHYIGTFHLMETQTVGEDILQLIDGQQRLTTLVILLFEVQRQLDQYGDATTARKIRGEYIARYGTQKLTLAGEAL